MIIGSVDKTAETQVENALTLKKMDDIIKTKGGTAYGYKCVK